LDDELTLFNFGLMARMKKRKNSTEVYNITGNIGNLAYMAPEVAMRKAYNEKVDIFSFGVIPWQLVHGEIPFRNMTREEHMSQVIKSGQRPAISLDLPLLLVQLPRDPLPRHPSQSLRIFAQCSACFVSFLLSSWLYPASEVRSLSPSEACRVHPTSRRLLTRISLMRVDYP
jgi:serine/threonine protein kinase